MADSEEIKRRAANKTAIMALMNDPRYRYTIGFAAEINPNDPYGYKEANLLPQLWWPIVECRVHPCGVQDKSHWRLSLTTAPGATAADRGKRTFFHAHAYYNYNGYSQLRISPGSDNWGPGSAPFIYDQSTPPNMQRAGDVSFTLPLTPGVHTMNDFLNALLTPTAGPADGVVAGAPMTWFHYTTPAEPKQCRHWVQAAGRALYRASLLTADPSPVFQAKNIEYGFPNFPAVDIPRGIFFALRPGSNATDPSYDAVNPANTLRPSGLMPDDDLNCLDQNFATAGRLEQNRLRFGFPGWN